MEKTSKLTSVQGNGTFNDLYKFELTFEDGTTGMLYRKTNEAKVENGQEYTYTINPKGTIKIVPPGGSNYAQMPRGNNSNTGISRDELIVRQTCIKAAVDFCKNSECSPERVTENAQIFRDWIFRDNCCVSKAPELKVTNEATNDDLPF
jgi:hypothetical protein